MATEQKTILLNNTGPVDSTIKNLYYPRIQVNKHGEIILAIGKEDTLTKGILIGLTPDSKSKIPLGRKFDDWEVVGDLEDYSGEVSVTLKNQD